MPALNAIIGANADPMRKELAEVEKMGQKLGYSLQSNLSGGHGGVKSGVIRETLVLMREISRGNWSRVPGSLSMLLQQLGIFQAALTGVGLVITTVTGAVLAIASAFYIFYKRVSSLSNALTGLKLPDFDPKYIAKHLQGINQILESQKKITEEIQKQVDLYNSAESAAKRQEESIKEHYAHLKKMHPEQSTELDKQERAALLANKGAEKYNLEREGQTAEEKAKALLAGLPSKEADEEALKKAAADAAAGKEQLKKNEKGFGFGDSVKAAFASGGDIRGTTDAMKAAQAERNKQAREAIQKEKDLINIAAENDEKRKKAAELIKQAGESKGRAAVLGLDIQSQAKIDAQKNKDEAEENAMESKRNGRNVHGHVNSLQEVGAFVAPSVHVDLQKKANAHLASIDKKLDKLGGGPSGSQNLGKPKF